MKIAKKIMKMKSNEIQPYHRMKYSIVELQHMKRGGIEQRSKLMEENNKVRNRSLRN